MTVLRSLLGAFVELDKPEAPPVEGEATADDSRGNPSEASSAKAPVKRYAPTTGAVDEEYVRILNGLVEKSTLPGYVEFMGQLDALKEDIPDEARLYNAALKSASRAHGDLNKSAVVAAVQDRIKILEAYATQFSDEVAAEEKKRIGGAEANLAAVEAQIAELQKSCEAMRSELASNKARYTAKREKFAGAHQALSGQLAAELEKVKTYLKG